MAENWANSRHFIRLTRFLTIGYASRGIPQAPGWSADPDRHSALGVELQFSCAKPVGRRRAPSVKWTGVGSPLDSSPR